MATKPKRITAGKLIVIEGPDGAGKSTLVRSLAALLRDRGLDVEVVREPGGTALSEQIRMLLKGVTAPDTDIDERAETLLFCAARAQLCREVIAPALAAGKWVLLDRFEGSTLIYQGLVRGLGVDEVESVSRFARGTLDPDRVIVLTVSAETSLRRMSERDGDAADRMEEATRAHLGEILDGYLSLERRDPDRTRLVNGEGQPAEVLGRALTALSDLL